MGANEKWDDNKQLSLKSFSDLPGFPPSSSYMKPNMHKSHLKTRLQAHISAAGRSNNSSWRKAAAPKLPDACDEHA